MSGGYQRSDAHIVDYELYQLPGIDGKFRGPKVNSNDYVACMGGAQTFGRFVERPFPKLIAQALEIEALNLGRGGAGPTFFLSNPELMERANRAQVVILQVLSGRSQSNTLFHTVGHGMLGVNQSTGSEATANEFYTWLMGQEMPLRQKIVTETRENYIRAMSELLDAIKPPKILLWLSVRTPEYPERLQLPIGHLWGEFPQLVNRAMIDRLRGRADVYIECVSRRGLPQPLFDRNGDPASFKPFYPGSGPATKSVNTYYPSPEMHWDAANLLIPVCRKILSR